MATPRGLEGAERELGQETARIAGVGFDPNRLNLPLAALDHTRTLIAGDTGGYLVPVNVLPVQDLLRAWSVTARAGVNVVSGLSGDTVAPYTATDGSIAWMSSEGAAATPGNAELGATTVTPHAALAVTEVSKRLLAQSPTLIEPWVRGWLGRKAGEALDEAVLNGSNSGGEPKGVLNWTISSQAGATFARATALTMKGNALGVNASEEQTSFIAPPAVQILLEGRPNETGGGSYVWQDGRIVGCAGYACTLMPSATLLSGPFPMVTVGLFGSLELSVNPFGNFRADLISLRIALRCDVALTCDPLAFTKATSIS
jgi:HK97 family phage major capsid protein